jgi:hypothetical protein
MSKLSKFLKALQVADGILSELTPGELDQVPSAPVQKGPIASIVHAAVSAANATGRPVHVQLAQPNPRLKLKKQVPSTRR